jgi:hypothetical protein
MTAFALMTAQAQSWAMRVDGTPAEKLTAADIAAACGHIHPAICAAVLRVKYCHDAQSGRAVLARLHGLAIRLPQPRQTAQDALEAFLLPPLCPTCHGRAQVQDEALLIVCPDCSGEGYRPVKTLSSDALSLLRALYEWEGRGLAQVVAAMRVVEGA